MPSGFRGTNVLLRNVTLSGSSTGASISFEVSFQDSEGVTHGVMSHRIDPGEDSEVAAAAQSLLSAITRWTERAHYSSASRAPKEGAARGIAEAIAGTVEESSVFGQDDS